MSWEVWCKTTTLLLFIMLILQETQQKTEKQTATQFAKYDDETLCFLKSFLPLIISLVLMTLQFSLNSLVNSDYGHFECDDYYEVSEDDALKSIGVAIRNLTKVSY